RNSTFAYLTSSLRRSVTPSLPPRNRLPFQPNHFPSTRLSFEIHIDRHGPGSVLRLKRCNLNLNESPVFLGKAGRSLNPLTFCGSCRCNRTRLVGHVIEGGELRGVAAGGIGSYSRPHRSVHKM